MKHLFNVAFYVALLGVVATFWVCGHGPKASDEELELKPRERGFPNGVLPKEPLPLTVEAVEKVREEKEQAESTFKSVYSNFKFRK